MGCVRAELLKLKRSMSWTVVVLLPVVMVVAGAVNTIASGVAPENGWHTVWLRSVVFHGLFPLAIGVGVLASLVWRVEHRDGNWNALLGGPVSALRIVAAKAVVVAVLAAAMQAVLLAAVVVLGKVVFALPGMLPGRYLAISVLIALACVPLAVLQSGLSMLMRSFAAPVAVAFLGAGAAVLLLLAGLDAVGLALPYGLVSRATQLGTGTFADDGVVSVGVVSAIVAGAVALTVALTAATTAVLNRGDVRART